MGEYPGAEGVETTDIEERECTVERLFFLDRRE